ncbi:Zn(II)2Cys6 transcription factor [Aspergillus clavatus NRRL 1]|uniref:C6 zinc finger domain protein n=1 Tax=Aspergillus clavatus (strain ATCC 1007 / CBS 513.65 / DSM 816 / NCTC 3887 / NRRL 1 / QM 1276 / 107) TaxID=344612 RepID=A1CSB0_ASPCL|nr:C6 zinc finger domain protein [Aspergillus clavatus NRRL 1]EAW08531.1 C6 zinc finger domain protein [Aspergillus clavatus NRRL 1]
MPRPRRPGAPEPKRRSRKGCWPCKARKVKCGEEKPSCLNCRRQNEPCDYSIRLNWEGRTRRKSSVGSPSSQSSGHSGHFLSLALLSSETASRDSLESSQPFNSPRETSSQTLLWDMAHGGIVAPEASRSRSLHSVPETASSPALSGRLINNSSQMNGRNAVGIEFPSRMNDPISPWPELSPRIMAMPQEAFSPHLAYSHATEDISYPSPADTSSSIGSFATLNFSVGSSVTPVSFMPQSTMGPDPSIGHASLVQSNRASDQPGLGIVSHAIHIAHPFAVAEEVIQTERRSSVNCSSLSSVPPVDPALQIDNGRHTDTYFNKIMNDPLPISECMSSYRQVPAQSPQISSPGVIIDRNTNPPAGHPTPEQRWHVYLTTVTDHYGLDHGRPDLDLNNMNDHSAIDINYALDLINPGHQTHVTVETDPSDQESPRVTSYGYYAAPVPINIPRYLSPVPSTLVETPINLMYFHHFLNHTAKMLVAHDCGDNPFISVLPSMAISDSNILNLALAYSASHRARYLNHPEPANRIAHWVSNVFPTLRMALEDSDKNITDNHLAAAIMLLSLKIISPTTFEVPIPWQSHLKLARDLFLARGVQMAYAGNRVGAFLARWLGYIDVLGALSCRQNEAPLFMYQSIINTCCPPGANDEDVVDCFTGYTPKTSMFLSQVGKLVYECDSGRFDDLGNFNPSWRPSPDVIAAAESLLAEFHVDDMLAHVSNSHQQHLASADTLAIDRAFRYAGLLHLYRRVLCNSSASSAVTGALTALLDALEQIQPGGAAEAGALFPLFTAGCETRDSHRRVSIMERIQSLEKNGMKQIQNARALMQRCWDEDIPWYTLAQGEFLG